MWRILQIKFSEQDQATCPLSSSAEIAPSTLASSVAATMDILFPTWWFMNQKWSQEAGVISDVPSQMKQDNTGDQPKKQIGSYFWLMFFTF